MKSAPPELLATCAYPIPVLDLPDDEAMDYALIRFSIESDVGMIIGNNIARMAKLAKLAEEHADRLIADVAAGALDIPTSSPPPISSAIAGNLKPNPARARELRGILESNARFIPAEYWPNLKAVCCWLSGSVGSSVAGVKRLFSPKTEFLDYGYGASEGKFNIPNTPGKSSGPLAIHAGFHEFIPADADMSQDAPTLLAHQLEDGGKYRLITTNFSGLYRYDMKDIVEVDGFTGETPNIQFVSKTGDIGNVAGEKLAGSTIAVAAATACERLEATLNHVAAVPLDNPPRYLFCVELEPDAYASPSPAEIADALDDALRSDIGYRNKRRDDLLKPPEALLMREGWLEAIYNSKHASGAAKSQTKLPVIHDSIPLPEFIVRKA